MAFVVFDRKGAPATSSPWVTVQKRGTFGLNKGAVEAMGSPEAVELLYDADARRVGFRSTDPEALNAYPLRKQPASHSYVLAGRAFTRTYQINTTESRRYDAKMLDGILVIDLGKPDRVVSRG